MMKIDKKYGIDRNGVVRKLLDDKPVPVDEPLIVFRAQDELLLPLLRHYAELCERAGSGPAHLRDIYSRMADIAGWQSENTTKIPDP